MCYDENDHVINEANFRRDKYHASSNAGLSSLTCDDSEISIHDFDLSHDDNIKDDA